MAFDIGTSFKITLWGQSHAPALGIVLDGLPAGESLDVAALQSFIDRRSAHGQPGATSRSEPDTLEVLSGLVDGRTCGAPLSFLLHNTNVRSQDYQGMAQTPRPSHADYAAGVKYHGCNDPRGGGFFSGRMTAPLCIAGGVAVQILERQGICINACATRIGTAETAEEMLAQISQAQAQGDSVGGLIACVAQHVPVGWGDPFFDGLESKMAHLLFSIPAVKGVEFGSGFALASMRGSEANDPFAYENGHVVTTSNHNGGINGGLSNGMPICLRVAIKPTPSIALEQDTINLATQDKTRLAITGRHDSCLVPRAVVCVESAVAIALLDSCLTHLKAQPLTK